MKMHLLEPVYVPAIRLFQRYKTMNANTVTASNEPTMKYHCTVVLAEKNKKVLNYYESTKNEGPKAKQVCSLLRFYCTQDCLQLKTTTPLKKYFCDYSCYILLCYTAIAPSLSIQVS